MGLDGRLLLKFLYISVLILLCTAENVEKEGNVEGNNNNTEVNRTLIEEGRTLVHRAVKRFMVLLPAIFFKLGIAFTMLILVAIASVNNGFIGFLLLVVGLSSVLARYQDSSRKPAAVPYYLPAYHHHAAYHHGWDRSDKAVEDRTEKLMTQAIPSYTQQYAYTPLNSYNPSYGPN